MPNLFRSLNFVVLFALFLFPEFSHAWWDLGHEVVAQIAYQELKPEVCKKVEQILEFPLASPGSKKFSVLTKDFVLASVWADAIKVSPFFDEGFAKDPYGSDCHFININLSQKEVTSIAHSPSEKFKYTSVLKARIATEKKRTSTNLISCMERAVHILGSKDAKDEERALALRYLIHLVGDQHQPLHNYSVDGNRGGNKTKVSPIEIQLFGSKKPHSSVEVNNLHFVWDAMLGSTKQFPMIKVIKEADISPDLFHGHLEHSLKTAFTLMNSSKYKQLKAKEESDLSFDLWSVDFILEGIQVINSGQDAQRIKSNVDFMNKQLILGGLRLARILNQVLTTK